MSVNAKLTRGAALFLTLLMIIGFFVPITVYAEEKTEEKIVRVGFYPCQFNIEDENGHLIVNI